jgi:predicted cupin superfamily sugar epimerase
MGPSADDIVRLLGLVPHPEGGHFRETFRDAPGPDGRSRSTAIYYLLKAGERSRWHRIDAAELWHFYAGAPLLLRRSDGAGPAEELRLGIDLFASELLHAVIPPGHWQSAESLGEWTLVGCTVAPGFAFEAFELAPAGWEPPSE